MLTFVKCIILSQLSPFSGLFDCLSPEVLPDPDSGVRMVCSSSDCSLARHLAHPKCFEKLEQAAVMALKNIKGRAREWSDKERHRVSQTP